VEQRRQLVEKVDGGPRRGVRRCRGQGQGVLPREQDRDAGQFAELDLHQFGMHWYEEGALASP